MGRNVLRLPKPRVRKGASEKVRTTKVHEEKPRRYGDCCSARLEEAWAEYEEWRGEQDRDEEK